MSNWSNTRPDIPDTWKGNMTDAQRVLGQPGKPIAYKTLDKYAKLGKRNGGIDWWPGRHGRQFTGKEIKRFGIRSEPQSPDG